MTGTEPHLAGAVLTTLLGVGAELAAPESRQDGNPSSLPGVTARTASIRSARITRRNMNIQPTLTRRLVPCESSSTGIWCCGRTSRCSSIGKLRNEHTTKLQLAAAEPKRQTDLCLPGQRKPT